MTNLSGANLRRFRQQAQIVFQDSSSALNPRKTIIRALSEPLALRGVSKEQRTLEAEALVKSVGLTTDVLSRFPHQLSGGQRQRIGIARALAMKPQFILADEPVSALDVSLQAHVMALLMDLRRDFNLTMVVISHDVSLVGAISDQIAVMYAGRLVEIGKPRDVLREARHPYTQMLLESIPAGLAGRSRIRQRQPSLRVDRHAATGCPFAKRCAHVMPTCLETEPHLRPISINHQVACHLTSERNEQNVAL
ncbi:MAG: ABC transporter ATP-binding protein [Vulcanimicrobiaceae bacterium]